MSRTFTVVDIVALVLLGMWALFNGLVGAFAPSFSCLVPLVGAIMGMGMVWFKAGHRQVSQVGVMTAVSLLTLGFGLFGLATPGDTPLMTNFVFAMGLCLGPGAFITLGGAGVYWYDMRKWDVTADTATPPATISRTPPVRPRQKSATRNPVVQDCYDKLERVKLYRQQMHALVQQQGDRAYQAQLQGIMEQFSQWEDRIERLVARIVAYEQDELLQRDVTAVPQSIANLETQLLHESDPRLRAEMEQTLAAYRRQQENQDNLRRLMRRTQLDLEETMAAMGTLYSQLQMLDALDIDSSRARRLSHEAAEEVNKLSDLLTAVEEVYRHNG